MRAFCICEHASSHWANILLEGRLIAVLTVPDAEARLFEIAHFMARSQ
jgi:hypothetical protein